MSPAVVISRSRAVRTAGVIPRTVTSSSLNRLGPSMSSRRIGYVQRAPISSIPCAVAHASPSSAYVALDKWPPHNGYGRAAHYAKKSTSHVGSRNGHCSGPVSSSARPMAAPFARLPFAASLPDGSGRSVARARTPRRVLVGLRPLRGGTAVDSPLVLTIGQVWPSGRAVLPALLSTEHRQVHEAVAPQCDLGSAS